VVAIDNTYADYYDDDEESEDENSCMYYLARTKEVVRE
jgi:hypothetical protein